MGPKASFLSHYIVFIPHRIISYKGVTGCQSISYFKA